MKLRHRDRFTLKGNSTHATKSRIALITFQVLDFALSQTAYSELSKNLARLGNTVDFFGITSKRMKKIRNNTGAHVIAFPMRRFPFLTHILYVILLVLIMPFYIISQRPDFVILEAKFGCLAPALESRFFPRRLRPKMILDIRSTPIYIRSLRRYLGALGFIASISVAGKVFDAITVASGRMSSEICIRFGLNMKLTRVWHNGVDVDLFRPRKLERERMRNKLGLSGKFVVFYHGSFRMNGGIAETIKSIGIMAKDYPDVSLFLLGGGPGLKIFENLIKEDKIEDKVIIHRPVDYADVPSYIELADIGIVPLPDIPDWRYQNPLKLIEYLAMGKTVIVSNIPANRQLVDGKECGIYLSSTTPQAIVEAISYAYINKEKLGRWGATGRLIVEEEYDWRRVARSLEGYLNELAR